MHRRQFITLLSGAASWPLSVWAQDRARRIGVLVPLPETDPVFQQAINAFTAAMKSAGWIEGRNLDVRIVSILGSGKGFPEAAAEVVALSPDAVIAITPVSAEALHRADERSPRDLRRRLV